MLDAELAEIVANLRVLGTDIADVEVKNSHGGLPKSGTAPGLTGADTRPTVPSIVLPFKATVKGALRASVLRTADP